MTSAANSNVQSARDYYNSADADSFYANVWGGEDIHIGIYLDEGEPIAAASRRTVARLAETLGCLDARKKVIDLGSGFGGAARYLARAYGCQVVGINLSEVENARARELNRESRFDHLIEIMDGSFESVPCADTTFDVAWSQDAILHSGDREAVFREAFRVLRPGGTFVFTDPMQADGCPEGVLEPILERIHLASLGSPGRYEESAARVGFTDVRFEDLSEHLPLHYERVLGETQRRAAELEQEISATYLRRMKAGLQHWIDGGRKGHLRWGIYSMKRP